MATSPTTQNFVPLRDVRDGIVLMKDGALRAVLIASSLNFALKSTDEQQAILSQFQAFLNTLDFSLQFYVQSRELDIEPYLTKLRALESGQENELMQVQLREYIGFIEQFTRDVDVMTKSFFIVVPYAPTSVNVQSGLRSLLGSGKKPGPEVTDARFEEHRTQLLQRVAVVEQGLARLGVRTLLLGTDEVTELFYGLFNPGERAPAAVTS